MGKCVGLWVKDVGKGMGGGLGKCVRVWGPNTLPPPLPLISLTSPFPTSPFISPTLQHTFLHLLLYLFPQLPSSSCTPSHFPTIPTYLPSSSQSVAKLPCDEVSVAKLPCGEVTGNQMRHMIGKCTRKKWVGSEININAGE